MNHLLKTNGNGRAIFNSFPAMFDDLFTKELEHYNTRQNNTLPAVNIKENANSFILELAVPGMEKENFNIELKNNTLTISAKKEDKKEDASTSSATSVNEKFICRQFGYQSFSRSFTLPEETTDAENVSANYNNGILNVVVPKKEKADSVKQIRIA